MISTLSEAYQILNGGLFDSDLPEPQFSPTLERKDILHFCDEEGTLQIGIRFITATPVEILDDLLHCMVHVSNHQQGISDVTTNQYHRIVFRSKALESGLVVLCHKTRGWGITCSEYDGAESKVQHPQPEKAQLRSDCYKKIDLQLPQVASFQRELQEMLDRKPSKQFQFKYVCQCDPPVIVRVGRRPDGDTPFQATCGYCDANFALDDSRTA